MHVFIHICIYIYLCIYHSNLFDDQGREINKNNIFSRFNIFLTLCFAFYVAKTFIS